MYFCECKVKLFSKSCTAGLAVYSQSPGGWIYVSVKFAGTLLSTYLTPPMISCHKRSRILMCS
jgi:hypothetical protein